MKIFIAIWDFIMKILDSIKKNGKLFTAFLILFIMNIVLLYFVISTEGNTKAFNKWKETEAVKKEDLFTKSHTFYATLKAMMKNELKTTESDYIQLIEFHNGSENVMTHIDFCKFDMTLSVQNPNFPYVETDDYTNENIFKYDILSTPNLIDCPILAYTMEELKDVDLYLYNTINNYNAGTQKVVICNVEVEDKVVGMLIYHFTDSAKYDAATVVASKVRIENTFRRGIQNEVREKKK